ncbi:Flowering time control protein FCA [Diplonema papillatum]|nr:Flowering time control protein FCA [Diplonema papillatum]
MRTFPSKGGRKLFVGQLHKHTQVEELRQLMSRYGALEDLHIIYDKTSGMGTGAAFVVYKEPTCAMTAVRALHGKHKFEGMYTNMQVRLAEGEVDADKDVKLFVGQVPPSASERDLEEVFERFGNLLEVAILRKDGKSRGCAFVRYGSRDSADAASNHLNGKTTLTNGVGPITVRLANTEADKRRKRDEKDVPHSGHSPMGQQSPTSQQQQQQQHADPNGMKLQQTQLQQLQQQLHPGQQQQQHLQQHLQLQQLQQQQQQQQQQLKPALKLKQPLFTPGGCGVPVLSSPNHQQQQQQQQQHHHHHQQQQQQPPQLSPQHQQQLSQQQLNQHLLAAQLPAGWQPQHSPLSNSDRGSSTSGAGRPRAGRVEVIAGPETFAAVGGER